MNGGNWIYLGFSNEYLGLIYYYSVKSSCGSDFLVLFKEQGGGYGIRSIVPNNVECWLVNVSYFGITMIVMHHNRIKDAYLSSSYEFDGLCVMHFL